jgi:transposase-like protein
LPWKESSPVTERERFVDAYMREQETVAELSRRFGISRKTGYKWIDRYMAGTELTDRSLRSLSRPPLNACIVMRSTRHR